MRRWHSAAEWRAEDRMVYGESHWDPCVSWGSVHDCGYTGSNSCGIPQRDPCPAAWRGRLFAVRYVQVRWLEAYIAARYGDPLAAEAFHERNGWY